MASDEPQPSQASTGAGPSETTPLVTKNHAKDEIGEADAPSDKARGLTVTQTTLLVVGEMAGGGVLALPRAVARTGWLGVPIIVLMGVAAAFSGKLLSDCWSMIEARDPDMRSRKRNPYSIIANRALGKFWSTVVSTVMIVTLFGASVVYLLMAAQIIEHVFLSLIPSVNYCLWYLIVVGAMTPLMMLRTPKDFSFLGIIALGTTLLACLLFFIQMMNDVRPYVFRWGIHGFQDFFLAFGVIMFAFGGAAVFPTIQNDMIDKTKFGQGLQLSFAAIIALYLVMSVTGYAVYGESVAPNLVTSLSATPLTFVGNVLMGVHLVTSFIIFINPVSQEMEELFNAPPSSTGWCTSVRLLIMVSILFLGESVPRFHTVLSLVGGSGVALLSFVLPPLCYLKLADQDQQSTDRNSWLRVACYSVMAVGVCAGVSATVSAVAAMFGDSMATPCFLR